MFYQQLMKLCKANNLSLTALVTKELGMSTSNVTKWRKGNTPKSDTIQRIAKYFNVSTDYLLGNEQKNESFTEAKGFSKEACELTEKFEKLSPSNRAKLSELVDLYLSTQDKK